MKKFIAQYGMGTDWESAVNQCLEKLGEIPATANLGFLYVTDAISTKLPKVLEAVKHYTKVDHWVGGVGIGISCNDREYYDTPAIALMLTEFNKDSFRIFATSLDEFDSFEAKHGAWYQKVGSTFGVVHGNPENDIEQLLVTLSQTVPESFFVGGLTSSEGFNYHIADNVIEDGLSGVLFSNNTNVATTLSQGCSRIGNNHTITAFDLNIIVKIDNRPALDVFKEDIGEILAKDLNKAAGYIFAGLPIPGSDKGDYLVRNIVGIDNNNKLIAVGELLDEYSTIMFCKRDATTALEDLNRMLENLSKRITSPAKGALYFSCLGRGRSLFGDQSEELKTIHKALGDIPLVGFFANGEISHNRLYGYTGVLTVFM